jgi:hypothetical protein
LGGIAGIPLKQGSSQIPASIADKSWEGLESGWSLNAPDVMPLMRASNRPPWLVDVIRDSVNETALQVGLAGNLGGDSLVFSQAGIVASGMVIGGNPVHSPEDVPSRIRVQSLQDCGRLVSTLLRKVMAEKLWQSSQQSHGPSAEAPLPGLIADVQRFEQPSNQGRFEALQSLLSERNLDFEVQHFVSEGDGIDLWQGGASLGTRRAL